MKPALSARNRPGPANWQQIPQGEALRAATEQQLAAWWPQIFGYYLLKVGDLSCQLDTTASPIKHHISLGIKASHCQIKAESDALPVQDLSMDALLLCHANEFCTDPHHLMREVHRVLRADGYLVLTGFNPFSLAGLMKVNPWLRQKSPWNGRFFTLARLKDWLYLLGFEVLAEQRFYASSLLGKVPADSRWRRWLAKSFGSSYLLVARKRELPLTPIRPKWQLAANYAPAVSGTLTTNRRPHR